MTAATPLPVVVREVGRHGFDREGERKMMVCLVCPEVLGKG